MNTPMEIIGLAVGLLLSLVGFLLNRSIQQVDEMVKGLLADVKQVQLQLGSTSQLHGYLEHRIENLERECQILRRSFNSIDRTIAQRLGTQAAPLDARTEAEAAA